MEERIAQLDKILPVVVRVHGDNHPELAEVGTLYKALREAWDNKDEAAAKKCLGELEKVTEGFSVPADACPTYEKTYRLLSEWAKEA
ncbi:MAG: iron-sulfur cluster repair di-iron protein, ric [Erysipelotrichaceae bacterium]|nr:iron-sulfur cluster repair di-iron protein, ric [Erysipelotrichaceae bacterium]